ncbi:LLM class F420-dependent oxidoreductase [Pseudonocardia humida]|uniref:LLM class F420-dependent oxidoreductase n=1 Tax=Pseudonocardia humida TaxID=2800819 RepID=A0ABT0ZZ61_9PSEU|nr:LLM class F420-dependent oxidoreductase [Pseudonocardia humida]MCO1656027.1 LLM class F420-dependent oxidoreductase [Pseudonocardia humida]
MTMELGRYGIWRGWPGLDAEIAAEVEALGYGAIWIGGSPRGDLKIAESLLAATERIVVATGIVNMWTTPAAEIGPSYHRLADRYPDRFLLGVGIGHPEAVKEYRKPYATMVEYLDALDAEKVPRAGRVLAALGPRALQLSADRTWGAHPYLTTPEHTRQARELLGSGPLIAPEQKVVVDTDPERARSIGRPVVATPYLKLRNYTSNLLRLGWTEQDVADGGSDALIDALVAHGDAASVAARLGEHLDAGADHVAVQALTADNASPLPALRELSEALGLR